MKLVRVDDRSAVSRSKYAAMVDEFLASDMSAARIDDLPMDARVAYTGFKRIARMRGDISVFMRDGALFIARAK